MAEINLTSAIRTNLSSLQSTAKLLGMTQERLSTGLKVNSALDNPANFFGAKSLNDRASDLSARKDGIGQGIQTLKASDKAIQALDKLVANAKSLANRALDEAATTYTVSQFKGGDSLSAAERNSAINATATIVLTYTDEFGNSASIRLDFTSTDTVSDVVDAVNNLSDFKAYFNSDGQVVIEGENSVSWSKVTGGGLAHLSIAAASDTASSVTDQDALDTRKQLASEFDELLQQMSDLVKDAGYKGVNLLNGSDLTVKFNEDGSSKLDISGVKFDPTDSTGGMYIANAAGNWASDANINAALGDVEDAINTLRTQASKFGSNLSVLQVREDFTSSLVDTLEEGAGKLVQADMNKEAANQLALQTRQQLATSTLAMAAQAEQGVLRLF